MRKVCRDHDGDSTDVTVSQNGGSLDSDSQSDEACQTDPGLQQYDLRETADGNLSSKLTKQSAVVSTGPLVQPQ